MRQKIMLLLALAVVTSCGDKHTFDTPTSGGDSGRFQQTGTENLESIVEIEAHENASDYYNDKFHTIYISNLSDTSKITAKDLTNLKSELNKVLKWDHTRVAGKRDSSARCARGAKQSKSCYSHDFNTYRDYSLARTYLYGKIHLKTNSAGEYMLSTLYCQKDFTSKELKNPQYTIGVMKKPDYNTINAEHIWPRSKFEEVKDSDFYNLKLADLHNLSPSFAKTNQERWNYPFGNVTPDATVTNNFSQYCDESDAQVFTKNNNNYIEAPDEVKGDIARAMFYMSVRYFNYKKPESMNIDAEQEAVLREWNKLDPVTQEERDRNDKVFSVQHNRNPFVDYPELVDLISDL